MHLEVDMIKAHLLKEQGYKQHEIAEKLGVTDRTVRNYLKSAPRQRKNRDYSSKLDPYRGFIKALIEEKPFYNCELLLPRLRNMGFTGGISILRDYVGSLRARILTEAVIRFETEPGFQAQMDWKELGRSWIDGRYQKLYMFTMSLGFSRRGFIHFTTSMKQSVLHACHVMAFEYFGGAPREILYDNMKTAFLCDSEGNFYPNRKLLGFAHHYGFTPKRCMVRRPQTKGKVERFIGYVQTSFLPRIEGDTFTLDELNEAGLRWLAEIDEKPIRDLGENRMERFIRELPHLQALPGQAYDSREIHEVRVDVESHIHFETNRYSVPPEYIREYLTLKVDLLRREGELLYGDLSIRHFPLTDPGAHAKITTGSDREALYRLWEKQRARRLQREQRKTKTRVANQEVEVRSPAQYDRLLEVTQ